LNRLLCAYHSLQSHRNRRLMHLHYFTRSGNTVSFRRRMNIAKSQRTTTTLEYYCNNVMSPRQSWIRVSFSSWKPSSNTLLKPKRCFNEAFIVVASRHLPWRCDSLLSEALVSEERRSYDGYVEPCLHLCIMHTHCDGTCNRTWPMSPLMSCA
jgi:hypothetical protein